MDAIIESNGPRGAEHETNETTGGIPTIEEVIEALRSIIDYQSGYRRKKVIKAFLDHHHPTGSRIPLFELSTEKLNKL